MTRSADDHHSNVRDTAQAGDGGVVDARKSGGTVASTGTRIAVALLGLSGGLLVVFFVRGSVDATQGLWRFVIQYHVTPDASDAAVEAGKLQLFASALTIASAPVFGIVADRYGKRRFVFLGTIVLGLSIAIFGWLPNKLMIWTSCLGQAMGIAILTPALIAFLFETTSSVHFLSTVAGLYQSTSVLSSALFPALGGMVAEQLGFRYLFHSAGIALTVNGLMGSGIIASTAYFGRSHRWPKEWYETSDFIPKRGLRALLLIVLTFAIPLAYGSLLSAAIASARESGGSVGQAAAIASSIPDVAALVSAVLGGLSADFLSFRMNTHRRLVRVVFMSAGSAGLCMAAGIQVFIHSAASLVTTSLIGGFSLGVAYPQVLALLIANGKRHRWGLSSGLFLAASTLGTMLSGIGWGSSRSALLFSAFLFIAALGFLMVNRIWDRPVG